MPNPTSERAESIVQSLQLQPQNGAAYLHAGAGLERLHELRKSVDVLRMAVKLLPKHEPAYSRLGVVLYKAATRVEWSIFRDKPGLQMPIVRIPGDDISCWREDEPNCFEVEHYGPTQLHIAEEDFLRRIEANSEDTRGVLQMGRLLRNCCVTASVQAIRLDPRKSTSYLTLAHVMPVGGSLDLYRRALQIEPKVTAAYLWWGDALLQLRYYKQANKAYRAALDLAPRSARGYLSLAEVRLKVNHPDDAYAMAEAAAALPRGRTDDDDGSFDDYETPDEDEMQLIPGPTGAVPAGRDVGDGELGHAHALMAEARLQQKRLADAELLASRALQLAPKAHRSYSALGHALYELDGMKTFFTGRGGGDERDGYHVRALDALTAASSLDPHDTGSRFRLGSLLRHDKKRLKEAMHQFQVVLRIDKQHEKEMIVAAKEALDEVVEQHRQIINPTRTWKTQVYNLVAMATFLVVFAYFSRHELRTTQVTHRRDLR